MRSMLQLDVPNRDKFFAVPEQNELTCSQTDEGYVIHGHDKQILYQTISKVVTTKSVIRVIKGKSGPAIATIEQIPHEKSYVIRDEQGTKMAEIKILNRNEIKLSILKESYTSQVLNRGKQFEFKDQKGDLHLTIDKKLLSLNDIYHIRFIEQFPALIGALTAVILDDIYHLGTTN